jgi:hypothetical protein
MINVGQLKNPGSCSIAVHWIQCALRRLARLENLSTKPHLHTSLHLAFLLALEYIKHLDLELKRRALRYLLHAEEALNVQKAQK